MLQTRLKPLPRKGGANSHAAQSPTFPHSNNNNGDDNNDNDEEEDDDDAEDIFSAFLPHLLPDDAPQFHGDPGQLLRYESPLYGPLTIMVPHYPTQSESQGDGGNSIRSSNNQNKADNAVDNGRSLFAHFLWSSALLVAQRVEDAAATDAVSKNNNTADRIAWVVKGHRVLELGAGAGLPSIISALSSAAHVTISDHPSSPAFLGAIEYNIKANVPTALHGNIESIPHEWGILDDDNEFARKNKGRFTRIIAADCLWMLHQHENLAKTLLWFLSSKSCDDDLGGLDDSTAISTDGSNSKEGRAWVVAGFHTGRAIVAHFFETAVSLGLEIETIYELDLIADSAEGTEVRRAWEPVRAGEGPENRQRWCVVAVLKRAKEEKQ